MKKIFTLLTAIMLVSALQAQRYKVLNIYKNGKISHTIKLSNIDRLKVAEEEIIPDGHEYVDLGLPSGTLWATCNIGADLPADYGDYFAWGEITSKESYTWSTYKFMEWKWGYGSLTKYCTSSSDGEVDDKVVLEPSDDATANWGSNWSMPTKEQLDELRNTNNTIWTWETMKNSNGTFVNGCKVVSKSNGNFIFLPATGYRRNSSVCVGEQGYYWSSALYFDDSDLAYYLIFNSDRIKFDSYDRSEGQSVRPVRASGR